MPFKMGSCLSCKRGGEETDSCFHEHHCTLRRPGKTCGAGNHNSVPKLGPGKARRRPEAASDTPRPAPSLLRHDPPSAARLTCKSRALGGRGPDDLRSSSADSASPPSAIFYPRAGACSQRTSRDFRGRLPGNRAGDGAGRGSCVPRFLRTPRASASTSGTSPPVLPPFFP